MKSLTTPGFWDCFNRLPKGVQDRAREKFALWRTDHYHPSLHFKLLMDNVWSVRITRDYRALGQRKGDVIVWFWIGTHADYDRLTQMS